MESPESGGVIYWWKIYTRIKILRRTDITGLSNSEG